MATLSKEHKTIFVFMSTAPYSADPLEYDFFYHHLAFGSVFGNLVSQYRSGEHTPEIAKSWIVNNDHTEWTFTFRKNLTYSDGSALTPKSYEAALVRMAKIMKARQSNSGVFEHIVGFDHLMEDSDHIAGLISTENNLTFKLNISTPQLLDKISFGLYSAAHPSMFDSRSLKWVVDKKNIVSSGPYKIIDWTSDHLILKLREDYPKELIHNKPLDNIEIFWGKELHPKSSVDIVMGSELSEAPHKDYVLQGGAPSDIDFMRVLDWKNKNSLFYNRKNRIAFRKIFYDFFEKNNKKIIRSFFPLIIKGVKELTDPVFEQFDISNNYSIKFPIYPEPVFRNSSTHDEVEATLFSANSLGIKVVRTPLNLQTLFSDIANNVPNPTWDIVRYGTGILASEPENDIKFMFKSKEGILLPDETGEILKELDKSPLNIQRINELLWEQGLIWPVKHFASGLWARPDLDFSQINLILPPTKFQWIGWK